MKKWSEMTKKERVLALISDSVGNLLYYDRKESEDFPVGAIDEMVRSGEITVDEMVAEYRKHLEHLNNITNGSI